MIETKIFQIVHDIMLDYHCVVFQLSAICRFGGEEIASAVKEKERKKERKKEKKKEDPLGFQIPSLLTNWLNY